MKIINNISSATLRIIYGNRNLYLSALVLLGLEMYRRFATNIVLIKEGVSPLPSFPYPSLLGEF